jgi:hypothetical protein
VSRCAGLLVGMEGSGWGGRTFRTVAAACRTCLKCLVRGSGVGVDHGEAVRPVQAQPPTPFSSESDALTRREGVLPIVYAVMTRELAKWLLFLSLASARYHIWFT